MPTVKSPYNFVPAPAEKEVYKPDWAEQVSHDKPFSDGESGELTIKITAETPIFIRNGHKKGTEENEFSHIVVAGKKRYFIPATSLKGMFRNVLEIMSFSKLNKSLVNDDRYAFRDLTNGSLYLKTYKSSDVKGGWLRANEKGEWFIEETKNLALIHHKDVDDLLGTTFRRDYLNQNPNDKTAKAKYDKYGSQNLTHRFDSVLNKNSKLIARPNKEGELGTIVLTGQPSGRNEKKDRPSGKVHEFVFFKSDNPNIIPIPEKMQKDFLFIYNDQDSNNISVDWKYRKDQLKNNEAIPVFYTKNDNAGIKHFGLSYMYKLPFEYSIHQMLPLNKYSKERDLSETIFGYIEEKEMLKGRVFFSHAFSDNAVPLGIKSEILASPKASYYPFYIKQFKNNKKEHNTYQDKASLSGFKRYPTQQSFHSGSYSTKQEKNTKIFSQFNPIKKGAEFSCKVRFHNLKKAEIGALISAISFHNNEGRCFHSLGGAKPYGYGKVRVEIQSLKFLSESKEDYLAYFEEIMGSTWLESFSLNSLMTMASSSQNLEYPSIEGENEFKKCNKDKFLLESYSDKTVIESFLQKKKLKEKEQEEELQRQEKEARRLEEARLRAEELRKINIEKTVEKEKFKAAIESLDLDAVLDFIREYPVSEYIQAARNHELSLRIKIKAEEANRLANQGIHFDKLDFGSIKALLNPYLKNKQFEFSDKQREDIYAALLESYKLESSNRKSDWNKEKYPKYPWSDIVKWLGEDLTKKLNSELN